MDIEKLGRYDIIRVLGKGAMGVVYEGRDPNLDRRVAIKTIRVQSLSAEAALEYDGRFRTEARSAARLHHPNIVSVFDSGQDGDTAYLVMEFISGDDLKQHLECGTRFSVRASIVMVHELLMALDHAHRQNVVHRDIKPANMLIEDSGRIKLTDFGVARIQDPEETNLTQVGGSVGTPKYMSPEQAKGLRGDSRSDLFSAAVVLYELLTGRLPFDGDNQFVIVHKIVGHEAAPPSTLNPDVPAAMDAVMACALAKDPDERYATAREFALALRVVAQQMASTTGTQLTDVAAEIGQTQVNRRAIAGAPLRDGSSSGIFGPGEDVSLVSTVSHDDELGAWNAVKDSVDAQGFLGFLQRFPSGIHARRARNRIEQLAVDEQRRAYADSNPDFQSTQPAVDLDTDVGHYASTQPLADAGPAVATDSARAPEVPDAVVPLAPTRRKKWLALAAAGVACVALAVFVVFKPTGSPDPGAQAGLAQVAVDQSLASATEVVILSTPSKPASASSVVAPPTTSPAAVSAPHAASAALPAPRVAAEPPRPTKPKPSVVSAAAPPPAESQAAAQAAQAASQAGAPQALRAEPTAVAPPRESLLGPSMPGQVCADRVFIFRIPCVAEQCATERYKRSKECVLFKQMEKNREEERNSRR